MPGGFGAAFRRVVRVWSGVRCIPRLAHRVSTRFVWRRRVDDELLRDEDGATVLAIYRWHGQFAGSEKLRVWGLHCAVMTS